MSRDNEGDAPLDYMELQYELVGDIDHVINSRVSKTIDNEYYSVAAKGNSVSIVFKMDIADQFNTLEKIKATTIETVDCTNITVPIIVEIRKCFDKRLKAFAVLSAFVLNDGIEAEANEG